MNTTMSARENEKREYISFDVADEKGRVIGAMVVTYEADYIPRDEEEHKNRALFCIEAGHYFEAYVHATRNGKTYGASHRTGMFKTIEERDAYISKRLRDSRKAAEKKNRF